MKNQFRTLDDSEVAFLESVQDRERRKEIAARQETAEQLEVFRKQRAAADQAALEAAKAQSATPTSSVAVATDSWVSSKKRRRVDRAEEAAPLAKQSKASSEKTGPAASKPTPTSAQPEPIENNSDKVSIEASASKDEASNASKKVSTISGLGLGAYSSDEDD